MRRDRQLLVADGTPALFDHLPEIFGIERARCEVFSPLSGFDYSD